MEQEVYPFKRIISFMTMFICLLGATLLWSIYYSVTIDRVLALLFLQLIFCPVLVLLLETERCEGRLLKNRASGHSCFAAAFLAAVFLYLAGSFLIAYTIPVMIAVMLLSLASNRVIGLVCVLYLNMMFCIASGEGIYELAAYTLLAVLGSILTTVYRERAYRRYVFVLMLAVSLAIPAVFYYLANSSGNLYVVVSAFAGGSLTALIYAVGYDKIAAYTEREETRTIEEIMAEDYPLVIDIEKYSQIDYAHAKRVSKMAGECAAQIGADVSIAQTAGFYYRLGKLAGEPFVENGVVLAKQNCFPVKLVAILEEYNGINRLPSTRESAIVHIVDTVITKFELLDKDTLSSTWNHDMVIYQTLNEISSSGMYDESGLGMNQYLKIREYLVKGVKLD